MTKPPMSGASVALAAMTLVVGALTAPTIAAQNFSITAGQRATATQVAQQGVPLSELADNAPQRYTIVAGDTLWAISKLFLKSPWRWPELWGMNLEDIKNPHRIYPRQVLVLERKDGRATLRVADADGLDSVPTERLSPQTRASTVPISPVPTLRTDYVEAMLVDPLVLSDREFQGAPRIVASKDERVLLTRGDRAYARGGVAGSLQDEIPGPRQFRIFRTATPLKDPDTGELLGHEAVYVGNASLVHTESAAAVTDADGKPATAVVPAALDITSAKEEIRVGDRLMPVPPRTFQSYAPRAPAIPIDGRIVSVYGSGALIAGENQVVAINRGTRDGLEPAHVLAILRKGAGRTDKQDPAKPLLKLPDERIGLLMVFRTFDRLSYALIMEATDAVQAGNRLATPR